jgi:hypothetical protein
MLVNTLPMEDLLFGNGIGDNAFDKPSRVIICGNWENGLFSANTISYHGFTEYKVFMRNKNTRKKRNQVRLV